MLGGSPSRSRRATATSAAAAISRRIRRPSRPRARPSSASSPTGRRAPREEASVGDERRAPASGRAARSRGSGRGRPAAASASSDARDRAERVRRRQLEHPAAVVEADPGRLVERGARRPRREVRRPPGGRGAVDVAEVGDRARSRPASVYQPPPQKKRGSSPCSRSQAPSRRTGAAGSPPVGRAWVGDVQWMWWPNGPSAAASRARSTNSAPSSPVGRRPHQRRDREAARAAVEQAPVAAPDPVVERPFDVARHDRVALRTGHVRDLRTPRQGRARPGAGRGA